MKIAWSPVYRHSLPEGHRFPMEKYEALPDALVKEGIVSPAVFFEPDLPDTTLPGLVHHSAYIQSMETGTIGVREMRKTGFPWSAELIKREKIIAQGSVDLAAYAFDSTNVGLNIAGGTHHAFFDRGEGFCLYNDIAIAAKWLKQNRGLTKIMVVDLDVHQGNGTAAIFEKDPTVFTLSFHGANNYPMFKENSNLDIGLPDGIEDAAYLKLLHDTVPRLLDEFEPQFVFYQAGVDILETDKIGRLKITKAGCSKRDELVFKWCKERGLGVMACMGGGYSPELNDIVTAHVETYKHAAWFYN